VKIVINAGHTKLASGTGASKYLNESIETRKIAYEVMKLLADSKHEVIPAVFDKSSNNLKEAVQLANDENADLFVSIHLNAGGGQGCEAYTWRGQKVTQAVKVLNGLTALGFKNRGIKDGSGLYVIKNTKCTAILIEVCFVDNTKDTTLYKNIGVSKIAKAIADGISN
jgi:N-acetylmuramoyl-L-alanine amidase